MKLSLAWYTSLCAAVHSARGDGDDGDVVTPDPTRWSGRSGAGGQPMRMRVKPRLAPSDQGGKKVVIVGSGYAGWGAAHRLVEGGMRAEDITILEADDTFGGRARQDDAFMPFPLDLGPSYIPEDFRGEVAALTGVPLEDLPIVEVMRVGGTGWYLWNDGVTGYNEFLAKYIIAKLDVCESKAGCRKQAAEMGLDFRGSQSDEGAYGCYSKPGQNEAFWGGGADEQHYTAYLNGDKERVNCDRINKEYGCRVTTVNYKTANRVRTTCDNGSSFLSTHAIVTVPLSVLKDGDITFRPKLPAGIQQNVDERAWHRGFKLFLEFDTAFEPRGVVSFGGAYDRDPDTEYYTGEHYLWDYTRYSAPAFRGERNLVGGYWIGSKADEFDGLNETQIVAGVLEKFADHYGDARGYGPDSYRRHLLVHWENPDVKPFVRGTHSGENENFRGHRADHSRRLFIAGEAFPAPLDEFCSSPEHCFYRKWWREMPAEIQEAWTVLGWDEDSWDKDRNYPDTEDMYWDELAGAQKEAATVLGYTQESWDENRKCATTPEDCYFDYYWRQLHEKIQDAYAVLGWTEEGWDNGDPDPAAMATAWDQLAEEQRRAAAFIGYTPGGWDARLAGASTKAAVPVAYEEEGWVYTALHSGQKAAEMLLARQTWSDLFAAEDFGTFGGTLGMGAFRACSKRAQVKVSSRDNFFLELKARHEKSCAKTKYFKLSDGVTKVRLAFKLRAMNFEDGDFFSVDLATGGDREYRPVLRAGTVAHGDGGAAGYVEIPQDKKWFRLGTLLDGERKWWVVKLEDLGTGSVDRISLQFTNHAADGNNQKVHLDDVSLQEFVPM